MKDFDVLVAGEINPDLILAGPNLSPQFGQVEILVEKLDIKIGSSSCIFACGAARLGLKVAFIGVVGDDVFGYFMLRALEGCKIDISNVIIDKTQKTGLSVNLIRGNDRAVLTYLGAINALRAEQISIDLIKKTRHLHMASYFLQSSLRPGIKGLFKIAKKLGVSTSLDTNWDPAGQWIGVSEILDVVDILFPNKAEVKALSGDENVKTAVKILGKKVDIIAVKLGADGAIAQKGAETMLVPAFPVEVIDTIGAGDSFDAGFIYGYLRNWPLERSLKLAVACGSLSTTGHGGTETQPTLEEALQLVGNI